MKYIYLLTSGLYLLLLADCGQCQPNSVKLAKTEYADTIDIVNHATESINDQKNKYGIWEIKVTHDEFGEPTNERHLSAIVYGEFNNRAVQHEKLRVEFFNHNFKLFEYNGKVPIKSDRKDRYIVLVQNKDGDRYSLNAQLLFPDMLTLDYKGQEGNYDADDAIMHHTLLKGGEIKFIVRPVDNPLNEYYFTIPNADGYAEALSSDEFQFYYKKTLEKIYKEHQEFMKSLDK